MCSIGTERSTVQAESDWWLSLCSCRFCASRSVSSVVTVLQTCKSSDPLPSQQPSVAGPAPKHILAALSALRGFQKEQRQLRGENGSRDMGNVREEGVGWI